METSSNVHFLRSREHFSNYLNSLSEENLLTAAMTEIADAISEEPNAPEISFLAGLIFEMLGQPHIAVKHWENCVKIDANFTSAYGYLGKAALNAGDMERALRYFDGYFASDRPCSDPHPAGVHFSLSLAFHEQGDVERAIHHARLAVEIAPDYCQAHYNFGSFSFELGRLEDAARGLEAAIEVQPTYAKAHAQLAVVYGTQGRTLDALNASLRAYELNPRDLATVLNLGHFRFELGAYCEAIRSYVEAIAREPYTARAIIHKVMKGPGDPSEYFLITLRDALNSLYALHTGNELTTLLSSEEGRRFASAKADVAKALRVLRGEETDQNPDYRWDFPLFILLQGVQYAELVASSSDSETFHNFRNDTVSVIQSIVEELIRSHSSVS